MHVRPIIEFSQAVYIMDPGFSLILAGYQPAWAMWYIVLMPQALEPITFIYIYIYNIILLTFKALYFYRLKY